MAGAYGFYYNGEMKISSYKKESHPKSLGYDIFNTLWYSWPQEIFYMFFALIMKDASEKPEEDIRNDILEMLGGSNGYSFNKPLEEISYEDLLGEKGMNIFGYFILVRHTGLRYMIDGIENIKTWGTADWVYIYNLNYNRLEVWYSRPEMPSVRTISDDPYVYLEENFTMINSMIHDPNDLGRNQFDLSGMDFAYDTVYNI